MPESADVLAFLDRKQDGAYPVFDTDGTLLARIRVGFWQDRFVATDPGGTPVCSGRKSGWGRVFRVAGAADETLFELRSSFWNGKRRTITLGDGSELLLSGASWPSRDWSATDAAGRSLLGIESIASGWSFHPDAYAVRFAAPLTLASTIGIVQANRMLVKAARSAAN